MAQTGAEEGDKKGMGGGREKKSRSPPAPRRTPPGSCSCLSPGGPRTKPRCPGTGSVPCSLPRTAQLFFSFFSFSFSWLPGQKGLDSFDQVPCQQTNQRATFGP